MKKMMLFLMVAFNIVLFAQIRNINPDKLADPWIICEDFPEAKLINKSSIIQAKNKFSNRKRNLTYKIDNSNNDFFREIFNQIWGSCGKCIQHNLMRSSQLLMT